MGRDLKLNKNNQKKIKITGFYAYGEKAEELRGKADKSGTSS